MRKGRETDLGVGFYNGLPASSMRLFGVRPEEIMLFDVQSRRGCLGGVGFRGRSQTGRLAPSGHRRGDGGYSGWHIGDLYAGCSLRYVQLMLLRRRRGVTSLVVPATTFNRGARPPIVKLDPTRTFSLSIIPGITLRLSLINVLFFSHTDEVRISGHKWDAPM